jgi:N-acetylmuramoyl-L-alanine amidase
VPDRQETERRCPGLFSGILLRVRNWLAVFLILLAGALAGVAAERTSLQTAAPAQPQTSPTTPTSPSTAAPPAGAPLQAVVSPPQVSARVPLSVVVLDPAHGGADPGARGAGGLRESDLVLEFAGEIRAALEKDGFRVVVTRLGNDNPTFDERSALVNGQRGAVLVSLHIGSTGLQGTARVYTMPDMGAGPADLNAPIPWDRAQASFLDLSRKLADLTQGQLAQEFKGSPNAAQTAAVRQLRTVAAPAIAIEVSSVTMEDRSALERMGPGLASCVERAVAAFRAVYDASPAPGGLR